MGAKKCDMVIRMGDNSWTETHYLPDSTALDVALTAVVALTAPRSYCFSQRTEFQEVRVSDVGIVGDSLVQTLGLGGYGSASEDPGLVSTAMLVRMEMGTLHRAQLWIRGQPAAWSAYEPIDGVVNWTTTFSRWADAYLDRLISAGFGAVVKLKPKETTLAGGTVDPKPVSGITAYPLADTNPWTALTTLLPLGGLHQGDRIVVTGARGVNRVLNGTWPLLFDPADSTFATIGVRWNETSKNADGLAKCVVYPAVYEWRKYTKYARRAMRTKKTGVDHDLQRGRARNRA